MPALLKQIEAFAQKNRLPIIGREKGVFLAEMVKISRPNRVLEIGMLVAYSTILIAQNLPKNGKITTLEKREDSAVFARRFIARSGLAEKIKIIMGDALAIGSKLRGYFDLVFIDAEKTQYLNYLKTIEPNLKPGAMIISDNVGIFEKEMKDFKNYLRYSGKYLTTTCDFGFDKIEVSRKR